VVFRAAAPAVPAMPVDGTDYSDDPTALYFDSGSSTVESLEDPIVGVYNYRVCNHDANLIYSNCNSGFWNNAGWLDSVIAPTNGWSHNLGGQMLLRPGVIPGGRVGVANNVPAVDILDASTGQRAFPPFSLSALPSLGTPLAQLDNGRRVIFAADQSGSVTAEDIDSGAAYWPAATLSGESFVAGVSGILHRYASPVFQEAYNTDLLLVGSTSGNLFALDASTGNTIWSINIGHPIRALVKYDSTTNWIYVATDGGGILAYDLSTSDDLGNPPEPAVGWTNPNPSGSYSLACTGSAQFFCSDRSGLVQIVDRSSGLVTASGSGISVPSSITGITGAVVVSNASSIVKLTISGSLLTNPVTWTPTPAATLSPALVFVSQQLAYVGGSDRKLHKVSLTTMTETASVSVASQAPSAYLGSPNYDTTNKLFLFGSSDGHLWAVKYF
jgi:outer membrane protein assembly factor BamB